MAITRTRKLTLVPNRSSILALLIGLMVAGSAFGQHCQNCVWPGVNATITPTLVAQTAAGTAPTGGRYTFAVDLCVNNTYRFSLCPAESGSTVISDSYMCLFAPACTLLVSSNDDFCGLSPQIDFTPTVTGLHILQVEPYSTATIGGTFTLGYRIVTGAGCGAPCTTSLDCDDTLYCNGTELCNTNRCQNGTPPNCNDNDVCTADTCDDNFGQCMHTFNDVIAPALECTAVTPLQDPQDRFHETDQRLSATEVVQRINGPIPEPAQAAQLNKGVAQLGPNQPRQQFDGRQAQFQSEPGRALSCPTPCAGFSTLTEVTNPWYHVAINCDNGAFTARSGNIHPITAAAGTNVGIIFGGSGLFPGTSDITFHVHNNNTNYINPAGGLGCAFDPPDTPSEQGNVGLENEWQVSPMAGMNLVLREEMVAFGNTLTNSGVRMTLCVESLPSSTVVANMGVRWQVDHWQVEDGPVWSTVQCDPFDISPDLAQETEFFPPGLRDFYRAVNNTGTPVFADFMNTKPMSGFPGTVIPDRVVYGLWGALRGSAWTYVANPSNNCDFDSAVLYYVGFNPADAFDVAPGTRECRSMIIFSSMPSQSCLDFLPGTDGLVTICEGDTATVGATSTDQCSVPTVTQPNSSAGAPACGGNPCTLSFPTAGTYVYDWRSVDPSGNNSTCQSTVIVIPSPIAAAGTDQAVCLNTPVVLDGSASNAAACPNGYTYEWRDSGGTVVATTPTWTPPVTIGGSQTYTLAIICIGQPACDGFDDVTVLVVPPPTAAAGQDQTLCINSPLTLNGGGSLNNGCPAGMQYTWRDSGGTVVATTPTWNPPTGTAGTETYTLEVGCVGTPSCPTTDTVTVTIVPQPVASAGLDFSVCLGSPVALDGSGSTGDASCPGGLQYVWRAGGVIVHIGAVWSPPTNSAGTIVYTLEASCAGLLACTSTDQATVTVIAPPAANAGPDQVGLCRGDNVVLDGSASQGASCPNGVSYQWLLGGTVVSTSPTYIPSTSSAGSTSYRLVVTCIGPPGCSASDWVVVGVVVCLPVVWDSYGARATQVSGHPAVEVSWTTLLEEGTTAFVVERSTDANGSFAAVGQPQAAEGAGFRYQFIDDSTPAGQRQWFRVVEYTVDGRGDVTPVFTTAPSGGGRQR